jgi:predicted dehydrogenase
MFHLRAIQQLPDVTVHAVSDVNEERMRDTQRKSGATQAYSNCDLLFKDPQVDAVAINTPPRFHEALTLSALEHGKHVLCEKPLAEKIEACRRIESAKTNAGLEVLPAHNYAFSPSLALMEEYTSTHDIGAPVSVDVVFENNLKLYRSQTAFRQNNSNGVLEDVLPHILSVIYPMTGHISEVVSVNWWCKSYDVCDNMTTRLQSEKIPVTASLSWTKLRQRFSVSTEFENGRLSTDLMMNPYKMEAEIDGRKETIKEKGVSWYLDLISFKHPSFKEQYSHFHSLIENGGKPRLTIDDEINILETINRIKEKMK